MYGFKLGCCLGFMVGGILFFLFDFLVIYWIVIIVVG